MAAAQKKEKGLAKHSFRGYTPDQINELSQEKVVELFRARMRRRFSRSRVCSIQRLNINTSVSMPSAKKPRRTHNPERDPLPSRLIFVMPLSYPKWLAITSLFTTVNPSTTSKSNSTWSEDISENFRSLTSQLDTVKLVSVQPRDLLTLP